MKNYTRILFIITILIIINGCSKSNMEEVDLCANPPQVSVNATATLVGQSTGSIAVNASGGTAPLMYSINGNNFQLASTFSNLSAGNYSVTVKDANNCTESANAVINEVQEVSYADDIRPIIDANCQRSGCHGSMSGIPDWSTYETVKSEASLIKTRTSEKSMPPSTSGVSLNSTQIQLIADWVDQGAPNN